MKTLHDILAQTKHVQFAVGTGTIVHRKLRDVIISPDFTSGDVGLVQEISARPELLPFFSVGARTEVPIAGMINGRFISRRIDRLIIDNNRKTISVIDYKTDTDRGAYRDKYVTQITEYIELLRAIYPGYLISGYILWVRDFSLEKIQEKRL